MAKNTENKSIAEQAQQDEYPLTLDEFCQRLSVKDRRVELIGAFEFVERATGREKDTEAAYLTRYEQFINQPA